MRSLGMLALGTFIGTIVTVGIRQTKDWQDLAKVLTTLVSAALAGGAFTFIEYVGGRALGGALFFYPVGLVLGMAWVYADAAVAHVQDNNRAMQMLGWLHVTGLIAITCLALVTLFFPAFRARFPSD